jgi:superfamily II DNA or RNA helicase
MALNDFEFNSSYNKIDHDIAKDFYLPCMRNSIKYDRITGYFASTVYIIAWDALKDFVYKNGKIRVICSPFISDEDSQAIADGNKAKTDAIIQEAMLDELQRMLESPYLKNASRLLACLISNDTIIVKLAIPNELSHPTVRQLFHDKVGIFCDDKGNKIGFRGSLNETFNGLSNCGNIESVDVFQSWDGGKESVRADEASDFFNRIWNGDTDTLLLNDLPSFVKEKLQKESESANWQDLLEEVKKDINKTIRWTPPASEGKRKELRAHQFSALESWKSNGYCGIFDHATGSGKTFTAICAIRDALIRNKAVIVLVPSVGLLEQWEKELRDGIIDIKVDYLICGGNYSIWRKGDTLSSWTSPATDHNTVVLVTMDTAVSDAFMFGINQGNHLLIIADEVHRIGSERRRKFLKIASGERLGLSATPIRYGDPVGTQIIIDYFGGVLKPVYSLQDAIHDGVLTKYFYYPISMHLSSVEQEEWNNITKRINKLYARLMTGHDSSYNCISDYRMKTLLLRRSRIVKNAYQKVSLARDIVCHHYISGQKWIVYCDNKKQLSDVLSALLREGIDAYEFHAEMMGDRKESLDYFSVFGGVLVSIRCLDEGIDIPSTTHALILASSKNPREFIQRRGRILRKSEGKNFAYLYDVVVTPNGELNDDTKTTSIIKSELSRAIQFGEWAENPSCIAKLKNIAIDYGVEIKTNAQGGVE